MLTAEKKLTMCVGKVFRGSILMSALGENNSSSDICIYLVQHGQAETAEGFADRPLSEVGKNTTEHAAAWASRIGLNIDEIWRSDKLRSKQTACIFAKRLKPRDGIIVQDGIRPRDDVEKFAQRLSSIDKSVMLVGHMPFLGWLAGFLLTGDPAQQIIEFTNSGIVGLKRKNSRWVLFCSIPPGTFA